MIYVKYITYMLKYTCVSIQLCLKINICMYTYLNIFLASFFFSLTKQMPASSLNYCYTGYHGADPELCVCSICVALFHPYNSKVAIIVFTL